MHRGVFATVLLRPGVLRFVVNDLFAVIIKGSGRIEYSSKLIPLEYSYHSR